MHRNKNFSLYHIAGIPYLLPFGQGIADHKRGVRINETGLLIWELLKEDRTEKELLDLYASHYEASESELPQMEADLHQYLQMLEGLGIINHDKNPDKSDASDRHDTASAHSAPDSKENTVGYSSSNNVDTPVGHSSPDNLDSPANLDVSTSDDTSDNTDGVYRYLSIGGLTLLLCGPKEAFTQEFDAFEITPASYDPVSHDPAANDLAAPDSASHDPVSQDTAFQDHSHIDQTITVVDHAPSDYPAGTNLLHNIELVVIQCDSYYRFLFPSASDIYEARLSIDGADARYYCRPPYTESLRYDLFHAIRLSFLYLAQQHDMIVLHSASMLYRDRAWLFSGHSGAGKSTHTNLWKTLYGTHLINGDLNLLSMEDGQPMVHGLPWCGTSGISDTRSYPLGGIILVKKSSVNRADPLAVDEAQLLVTQRLISPNWTENLVQKNLDLTAAIAPHILICRLYCTKEPEAAETCKQTIDSYLDDNRQ